MSVFLLQSCSTRGPVLADDFLLQTIPMFVGLSTFCEARTLQRSSHIIPILGCGLQGPLQAYHEEEQVTFLFLVMLKLQVWPTAGIPR